MLKLIPAATAKKAIQKLEVAFAQATTPPPRLSLPDWADKFRRLSSVSGAIGGPWRTSRVEVARGPMMAVKEKGVRTITVKTCTQLMKTSLLENIIGYHAHLDPCPILMTLPKAEAVKSFSKERLAPMTRATPVLQNILGNDRQRGGEDTLQYKQFPGGFLAIESAGSPTNLAMRPIRITVADEIDKYETTKEGDPVILLEERTSTFNPHSLHVRACSPTTEESSRIDKSYNEGDQRKPFVPCPHCGYMQTLDFFKHVHWGKTDAGEHFPFTAAIFCEDCGAEWTEAQRLAIITTKFKIKWRQTRPFVCCDIRQEPTKTRKWKWDAKSQIGLALCEHCERQAVPNTHASFTASKLYSPFITVPELASAWILAKDHPETKQTFYNTQLGLAFHAQTLRKIEGHTLAARREAYDAPLPLGVLILTAGIDVQAGSTVNEGRLECEVVGWGIGEESWSIEHKVFIGDPARPEVWNELDDYLKNPFLHALGFPMVIRAACIDSGGHNTEEVYKFCRARIGRKVWAIKGASDRGGQWSPVWPVLKLEPRKTRLTGYRPIMLGVNAAKEAVRQRLLIETPGPGYSHFHMDVPDARLQQFTSEDLIIETKGGVKIRKWVAKRGRANEALDCRVYAYAALCGWYASGGSLPRVALQIAAITKQPAKLLPSPPEELEPDTSPDALPIPRPAPPPMRRSARVRRSSWMNS